jgi:excisionase family DNA binding protein
MLTTDEFARTVRMQPETISGKCRTGEIRARKVGKRWLIAEDELYTFMNGNDILTRGEERELNARRATILERINQIWG